jgi:uncharacterized protein
VESYSIKRLEPLYGFTRTVPLRNANLALQTIETAMALGDIRALSRGVLDAVETYNRDDCFSALHLRDWLETQRRQLETGSGQGLPRPAPKQGGPSKELAGHLTEVRAVMERLMAGVPEDESARSTENQAQWLLAYMLEWHRREEKSSWWEYFRLCELSDDELIEDKKAIGGLVYDGEAGYEKRSIIHRYSFPPQEHAIDRARAVHDPRTQKSAGQLITVDDRERFVYLKRAATSQVSHPTALIPLDIIDSSVLRDSLLRLGTWVADHGIVARGPFRAARDLLLRRLPRLRGTNLSLVGERTQDPLSIALATVIALDDSVLPVQGPPGSGKTYAAARMAIELVRRGQRVGITAVSHKVITKLLQDACDAAYEAGVMLRITQKANDDEDQGCEDPMVTVTADNGEVRHALSGPGTTWQVQWTCF